MKNIKISMSLALIAMLTSFSAAAGNCMEGDKLQKTVSNSNTKSLDATVSDSMVEKLAEALRWELNNYGPASSNDDIDYQVVEVINAEKNESEAGTGYTINVKFNTGSSQNEAGMIVYQGMISESTDGHLSVTEYKPED